MTARRRFPSCKRTQKWIHGLRTAEQLEHRVLLAGDAVSAWQNHANPYDVDGSGHVTPADAFAMIRHINLKGFVMAAAAQAAGEPEAGSFLPDVNGDGRFSPADIMSELRYLNGAEGEGDATMQFRLEVTDLNGLPVTTARVGEQLQLRGYIQDLRDAEIATGLFAAYVDVEYDASFVSVPSSGAISFTSDFPEGAQGDTSLPGLINEVGAFRSAFSGLGTTESLLFTVDILATSPGTVTFTTNAADDLPNSESAFYAPTDAIPEDEMMFGSIELTIAEPVSETADLVAFAQALESAGVQLWSTSQFSRDAVAQRELFEDGAGFLPIRETLDAAGNITAEAAAAGITQVNTWLFPGEDGPALSDGSVLTLAQLSERSGVAIPTAAGPTLFNVADVTLFNESPLMISLDAYDPSGGGLQYEFTIDDPGLFEIVEIADSRSWALDVDGYGRMTFQLFEGIVPDSTARIIELTSADFYDGLTFYRVIDNFAIEGGDPNGDGTGGSDLGDLDDEFATDLQHNRSGVLSWVKDGENDDTNNSRFLITEGINRGLDFQNSVLGVLTEGESIREAISEVPTSLAAGNNMPLSPVTITQASVFSDLENRVLLLRPVQGQTGTTNVTVTATDSNGISSSQSFEVMVEADDPSDNSQPFLGAIANDLTAPQAGAVQFQLTSTDIEGDPVFYFARVLGSNDAMVSVSEAGNVAVRIPNDFPVGESLSVQVAVSSLANPLPNDPIDTQVVSIEVTEPLSRATDDSFVITEDDPATALDVLANDGFPEATTITELSTAFTIGAAEISADGKSVLYTPAPDFFGVDAFDYFVMTLDGTFAGRATITVEGTDDPPMPNDDVYPDDWAANDPRRNQLREDSTQAVLLDVLSNDTNLPDDVNQEIWTITNVSGDAQGTVNSTSLNILYTPRADFFGADTFTYTVTGFTTGVSATATVTVNISEVNDAPVVVGESVAAVADQTQVFKASDLLANDSPGPENESGQSLRIVNVIYSGDGLAELTADGNISYTPAAGFTGEDVLMYVVQDDGTTAGSPAPLSANATLVIDVATGNSLTDDAFVVPFASANNELDVLANDGLDGATIIGVQDPDHGTASVNGDGTRILYSPDAGYLGNDIFSYTVEDAGGVQLTGSITVTVEASPPTAIDDAFTVGPTGDSLNVLANDQLGAGATSLRVNAVTQPANGVTTVILNGVGVTYQPNTGFTGVDTFTYTVIDNFGNTSTANIAITVEDTTSENAPPRAFDDNFDVVSDVANQELDVLANDTILPDENETLTIDAISVAPLNGMASINAAGDRILYTPDAGFAGMDSFIYQISDGNGGMDTALVQLNVLGDNTGPPTAINDSFTLTKNLAETLNVLANDSGDGTLSIDEITIAPLNGSVTINANADRIVYTPDVDFVGTDTFVYRVIDADGESATAQVNVTVEDDTTNIPAVAMADTFTVDKNATGTFDVLINDTGNPALSITAVTVLPANGTATINAAADRIVYMPAVDFVGVDSFRYEITDADGETATAEVTVTVRDDVVNLPPVAEDDAFTFVNANARTLDVLANDTGEVGEMLTISAVQVGSITGSVDVSGDQRSLVYTPAAGFFGTEAFTYTIDDGTGLTDTATVSVTVLNPAEVSAFSGVVFTDYNNNGIQEAVESGLGGVTLVLDGTDAGGTPVHMETKTDLSGAYRFEFIAAGQYTVSQRQPLLTIDGLETSGGVTSDNDQFDFTVGAGSTNSGNGFAERGLHPRYAAVEALASVRGDGLLVVLQNGQQQWVQERGGWDDVSAVEVSLSGQILSIVATNAAGVESVRNLALATRGIQVLSQYPSGEMMLRVSGSAAEVLGPAAVDAIFAS